MRFSLAALGLAGLAGLTGLVGAQTTQYCDPAVGGLCFQSHTEPVHNISFRIVFPPGTGATEFIGVIEAPTTIKWAGWAIKGQMLNHPLLVGWPNAGAIVKNVLKIGVYYDQPTPWGTGPVLTTLPQTTIGSSTWKWVFRCQNCTTWSTGSFNPDDVPTMGWASGTVAPDTPSSPNTTFIEHDNFNFWGCIAVNAHDANYNNFLNGGTATTTITTTTTTTSTTPTVTVKPTPYDYIVVGAGAGGIVVAERLAATGKKVILLERGGPSFSVTGGKDVPAWGNADDTRFDVPGLFEGMFGGTYERYWWCKDVAYWAGCLTGGGTSVNAALYWLPTNDDFSTNNGWPSGWQSISAPVSRLTARLPSTDVPSPDGKLYLQETYGVVEQILKPLGYTNITINNNVNFKDHVYGHTAYNFKNGKRAGPVVTYLQDSLKRANFTFKQYVYVQSVVRNGGQITGVQTNDTTLGPNGFIPVTAKGRVILSAGAFGTARLLFTSGIGPSDMINVAKGNPTVGSLVPPSSQWINLPVGSYVQDNPSINLIYEHPTVDAYDNWDADILWSSPRTADKNLYKASNSGVFAGASPRINFWQAVGGSADNKTRWLQGTVRPGGYGINTTQPYNSSRIFLTTMYLSYGVTSRGRIGIDAAMKGITITRPWFTDPYDKAAMIRGINSYITAAKSVPNLKLVTPDLTSTTLQAYVDNYVPDTMCSNHWLASARIGTSSSNSVVDVNTKVWNTTNLFIVDASIFPSLPMSNPHAAIMVSAEIAADKIIALAGGP